MRSRYKIIEEQGIYFLTSTIIKWIPIFTKNKYCDILIDSFKYCQQNKNLSIICYVIMENHFHLIASGEKISDTLSSIKKFTAKRIIEELKIENEEWKLHLFEFYKAGYKNKSEHQIWQEGIYPKQIIGDKMLAQKIEYIHYNPVRRGLVENPEYWRYSSAGDYILEKERLIKIERLI